MDDWSAVLQGSPLVATHMLLCLPEPLRRQSLQSVATVLHSYKAANEDELTLIKGELVLVYSKVDCLKTSPIHPSDE